MEPIPSIRIIKYVLFDQFQYKNKQQKYLDVNFQQQLIKYLYKNNPTLSLKQSLEETTFTVFDLETTGFFPRLGDEIVSIGAMKMNVNQIKFPEHFYEVISPIGEIPDYIYELTNLTKEQVGNGKTFQEAFLKFLQFSQDTVLVAHPASFDVHFLKVMAKRWGLPKYNPLFIDSYFLANFLQPKVNNKLDGLVSYFHIEPKERHHALNDAQMTAEIFMKLLMMLKKKDIHTIEDYLKIRGKKKGKLIVRKAQAPI
ncbi:3'-5' exoribonuclease [Anaerobacillus sp. CMMVII]|uniref:3'-5' exonuclease n=1 Tax=Anaerobacillus sp. CMMVII TaxID=2755588 RepID=UPI0021B81CE6|nr:exonuclease domain-containing protein [Anaerobacillus sp. CMMVII]MCT8137977.1 3'-5' exoribonuclease [Anaerobacillus sp. CMMVII]